METRNQKNLKIIHLGSDPEYTSPIKFNDYIVEINSFDNVFSAIQWISSNGLPDAMVCEKLLPAGNGFDFYDFWIEVFDQKKLIPYILLIDDVKPSFNPDNQYKRIEIAALNPDHPELLIQKILQLQQGINDKKGNTTTSPNVLSGYQISFLKRLADLLLGIFGLIITAPFMVIIMLAILFESKGRAIYASKRVGTGYHVFNFYKFRSTYLYPDSKVKELSQHNPNPKITKVGQLIRKFSLDELPQVINLIKGDISLVGNRPLAMFEAEMLTTSDWKNRMHAPAGVTGLWKIEPRRNWKRLSTEERQKLDNRYDEIVKKSFSCLTDFSIILRTIPVILRRRNVS
jgi:lipopolysaccharide/colanic/teichoic acid biosynthesis glycosyltransferase